MVFIGCMLCSYARSQYIFKSIILDAETHAPLSSVSITEKKSGSTVLSDKTGLAVFNHMAAGKYTFTFNHISYKPHTDSFSIPLPDTEIVTIFLEPVHEELDEVVIVSTRTNRSFSNSPTRVEILDSEELQEKNNMRPSNVSMLLHESTGMQVQQTSATSANASIRMQGLDGRYTQLLKDGYPNFGNFAGGLSILEIPPLDLKQVEVIKGPSSTLYGGGAIAGVVNFISKTPKEVPEYNFLLNQSNIGQTNVGAYLAYKKGKFGYTFLGQYNYQKPYDVDKDEFSELPELKSFTINPTLYFYPSQSAIVILGNSLSKADYLGGDMKVIKDKADSLHSYFEKNKTLRNISRFEIAKSFKKGNRLSFKQSVSFFNREINIPGYSFKGSNSNSYSELSYSFRKGDHFVVGGLNLIFDKFRHTFIDSTDNQSAKTHTAGLYVQDTWDVGEKVKLEAGLRADYVGFNNLYYTLNQVFVLPRISLLVKFNKNLSSRIGSGLGYKPPTIFTEQTEAIQYRKVLALNGNSSERSLGITGDVNYRCRVGKDLSLNINQFFFYSFIRKPLVLQENGTGYYYFINSEKAISSYGFETNLRLVFRESLKFFAGYTYTNARGGYLSGNKTIRLVPKHKLNLTLVYEKEDNFKLGIEGYFTGNQYLNNGYRTPSFWEFGFMGEKTFRKISLFVNFENFTDQRQSKYKAVVNPPHTSPTFDDIWNHTEGFVFNGGIKLKF